MLLHNLPEQGINSLADYNSLKDLIDDNFTNRDKIIILGTSSCGKTRLCFEALCHNYGLYLISFPYKIGSNDLEISSHWTKDNINNKGPKEILRIAERAVMSCIVG